MRAGRIRIGISGWRYPPWRRVFYPEGLPQRRELEYAARQLQSIEINGSFYSLQRPQSYLEWRRQTPAGFVFSVKGGRFITHMLKLRGVEQALANFFASGVLALGDKLGPILWQLPPVLRYEPERMQDFLRLLPRDTMAAAALAQGHAPFLEGRAHLQADARRPLRHALEIRHPSFVAPSFVQLLRRHRVALVIADTAGNWPYREDVTSDFVYLRLHGAEELYASGYTDEALSRWAARIIAWSEGAEPADAQRIGGPAPRRARRDVYCYFDNDAKVRAPFDALSLMAKVEALQATGGEKKEKAAAAPE